MFPLAETADIRLSVSVDELSGIQGELVTRLVGAWRDTDKALTKVTDRRNAKFEQLIQDELNVDVQMGSRAFREILVAMSDRLRYQVDQWGMLKSNLPSSNDEDYISEWKRGRS